MYDVFQLLSGWCAHLECELGDPHCAHQLFAEFSALDGECAIAWICLFIELLRNWYNTVIQQEQ